MLLTKVATAEKYQIKNWLDDKKKMTKISKSQIKCTMFMLITVPQF